MGGAVEPYQHYIEVVAAKLGIDIEDLMGYKFQTDGPTLIRAASGELLDKSPPTESQLLWDSAGDITAPSRATANDGKGAEMVRESKAANMPSWKRELLERKQKKEAERLAALEADKISSNADAA